VAEDLIPVPEAPGRIGRILGRTQAANHEHRLLGDGSEELDRGTILIGTGVPYDGGMGRALPVHDVRGALVAR
jgi:hypothetical protein